MKKLFVPLFALLTISCFEQGDCSDYSSNVMQVNFYNHSDKKTKFILLDSIKLEGWDSVMYAHDSISSVKLPLNVDTNSARFYFYYGTHIASLQVDYLTRTFALAPDCSAIDLITLQGCVIAVIEDFKISQPEITSNVAENIKLYF